MVIGPPRIEFSLGQEVGSCFDLALITWTVNPFVLGKNPCWCSLIRT